VIGSAVELGGPSGSGPLPARQPSILDVEEALVDKAVEVELRAVPRYAECRRRLIASDRFVLLGHVEVEGATRRLREGTDALHLPDEVFVHDGVDLSKRQIC
jgi:hypothetical protein